MASQIRFETPENVQVAYEPAGLGTRFAAWVLDGFFVTIVTILLIFLAAILTAAAGVVVNDLIERLKPSRDDGPSEIPLYVIGIGILLWGLGSFVYFTLSELLWRGQTFGKRRMKVRVVKADGFALDAGSIFLRNVFRIVDQIPPLWIVPVLSSRGQRFGDMVAGTVVVAESREVLGDLRSVLLARPAAESKFRFDGAMLSRTTTSDIDAVERILGRWSNLSDRQREELLERVVDSLVRRIGAPPPEPSDRHEFLEDLLAAAYRREVRRLG